MTLIFNGHKVQLYSKTKQTCKLKREELLLNKIRIIIIQTQIINYKLSYKNVYSSSTKTILIEF